MNTSTHIAIRLVMAPKPFAYINKPIIGQISITRNLAITFFKFFIFVKLPLYKIEVIILFL